MRTFNCFLIVLAITTSFVGCDADTTTHTTFDEVDTSTAQTETTSLANFPKFEDYGDCVQAVWPSILNLAKGAPVTPRSVPLCGQYSGMCDIDVEYIRGGRSMEKRIVRSKMSLCGRYGWNTTTTLSTGFPEFKSYESCVRTELHSISYLAKGAPAKPQWVPTCFSYPQVCSKIDVEYIRNAWSKREKFRRATEALCGVYPTTTW